MTCQQQLDNNGRNCSKSHKKPCNGTKWIEDVAKNKDVCQASIESDIIFVYSQKFRNSRDCKVESGGVTVDNSVISTIQFV